MVLDLKHTGSGTTADPFRVSVPTYTLLDIDYDKGISRVAIPDAVHGQSTKDLAHEHSIATEHGPHFPKLCDDCIHNIHRHWDARYKEHAGAFRLKVAQ